MINTQMPWEGTGWIKQCSLPKVPQIVDNGQVLNDLDKMFNRMHEQFAQSASTPVLTDLIDGLPQRATHSWPLFLSLELDDVLLTCSNTSVPGPSHLSWEYIKIFLKDDAFRDFFLRLANDIMRLGTWPDVFKLSTMVIIPKPKKDDYLKAKSYRPIALLKCPGKHISKLIANRLQLDIGIYDIAHLLQFGGHRHHSTLDAGLFLTEYITKAHNAGLYTSTLALDVAQFFPSLNKDIVVKILLKEPSLPGCLSLTTMAVLPDICGTTITQKTMMLTMVYLKVISLVLLSVSSICWLCSDSYSHTRMTGRHSAYLTLMILYSLLLVTAWKQILMCWRTTSFVCHKPSIPLASPSKRRTYAFCGQTENARQRSQTN